MRIACPALGIAVLLLALPPLALPAAASPAPPYHLATDRGHDRLLPADWRHRGGGGHHRAWDGRPRWRGLPWLGRPLPVWVVEHRLRRQHLHPVGRITLRHGLYVVPVCDPLGRRILLAVDPHTAVVLGRVLPW